MTDAIDRTKLREQMLRQGSHYRTMMLWQAVDFLTDEQIRRMVDSYLRVDDLLADPGADPEGPLEQVRVFHERSVKRTYYDAFEVNWRNSRDMSHGTTVFIAEFHRLVDLIRDWSEGADEQVLEALDLLLDLLDRIDNDGVIFLADEAGGWQVQTDWSAVLPVYFRALAAAEEPVVFAEKALARVNYSDVRGDRERWLAAAIVAGSDEQGEAVRAANGDQRRGGR